MAVPPEHLTYLRQKGYTPICPNAFSDEETALLDRYGHWMEALASGRIAPTTPEQIRFLQVTRREAEPESPLERVWSKLCSHVSGTHPSQLLTRSHYADQSTHGHGHHKEPCPKLEQLAEVKRYLEAIRGLMEGERDAILQPVHAKLQAIDAKYAQPLEEAVQALAELESEVKAEVLELGRSVSLGGVQAVFYHGRVTWDSKGLAHYAQANPEVQQFRKLAAPSVAIRYRKS